MQLKTLNESLSALNIIKNILSDTTLIEIEQNELLANSLKGYSIEEIKATLTQQELTMD